MLRGVWKTWRKHKRPIRIAAAICMPVMLIALWLVVEHKPAWYAPARLDDAARRAARRSAASRADAFGDLLVRRRPFDFVLAEDEVNGWLASAPEWWPRAKDAEWRDPVVRFEPGTVRLGALVERGGWRAIVSVAVGVRLASGGSDVELQLEEAFGGSLPIPLAVLGWAAARNGSPGRGRTPDRQGASVDSLVHALESVDELLTGVRRPNWFVWPNGDRAFSIEELTLEEGRLKLRIRPR